jgi:hypothetical protein
LSRCLQSLLLHARQQIAGCCGTRAGYGHLFYLALCADSQRGLLMDS